ncbi:ABC transporter ATP-binding protein [Liquorilactobacillus mali]|uniref:ABC transporter ATP-binding protein n=1 Tax=Liquorilactobacillus mali TaxID=1618 RepID=UPI0039E8E48B
MQFEELTMEYNKKPVFHGISGALQDQRITVLLGPNGSGKTTLMMAMAQLKNPSKGRVIKNAETVFYLSQKNQVFDYVTVGQLLEIAQSHGRKNDIVSVEKTIKNLGLTKLLTSDINTLSGGQQQRTWLAYAFLQATDILLLDEPMTYLDVKYQQVLYNMIMEGKEKGQTFLVSLHDIEFTRRCSDNIWFLTANQLVSGTKEQLLTQASIYQYLGVKNYFI